jgi:hypothetical protein
MPTGLLGEKAPEVKMSKKAREALEKSARAENSEEKQTLTANQTASMALGGKAKKYAWMTKGGPATPARTVPGKTGAAPTTVATIKKSSGVVENFSGVHEIKYGKWREDGIGGRGIQLRDWIGVLEVDGREKRTLGWAYTRQGIERSDGVTTTIMSAEAANALSDAVHTATPSTFEGYEQQAAFASSRQIGTPVSATANFSQPWSAHQQGGAYAVPQSITGTAGGAQYAPTLQTSNLPPQQSQSQSKYQTSSQSQPSVQSYPSQSAPSSQSQGLPQVSQHAPQHFQAKSALATPSQIPPQTPHPAPTQNRVATT